MDAPQLPPDVLSTLPPVVVDHIRILRDRIAELEATLHANSTNSSRPPSSDPPTVKHAPPRTKSGKKPGGQPGHPRHLRPLVDAPDRVHDCKPTACRRCQTPLAGTDPQPLKHQVTDIPPVRPTVTEYRQHRLKCTKCGATSCGSLPDEIVGQDGPRLRAACVLLTGTYRLGKSNAARLLGDFFGVSIASGQVCATEADVGQRLQPAVDELLAEARKHPANVDETGMGKGRWLWVMVTSVATIFQIAASRSRVAYRNLVGTDYRRVTTTDRLRTYDHLPAERHQYCWAHLRRDFQAMIDRRNAGAVIGAELLRRSDELFRLWHRVRDGTLTKYRFGGKMHAERAFRTEFREVLSRGVSCGCAKTSATCRELLEREVSLYTFAFVDGVEPTNNAAERAIRHGVLWRKSSGGPRSESGAKYLANVWSVVETCRQRGVDVWGYLSSCIESSDRGVPLPSLLPARV